MASIKALHMRSSQDAIQDKPVRQGATTRPSSRQQRKHPSLYVLRTWARKCKPVRLTAKVAEEGLELVVVFAGKSYILSAAGDKLGIISAREKR